MVRKYPSLVNPVSNVNGLVLSIDLAATALDIANIDIPNSIQGKSLLPLIQGETESIRPVAFIEYYSHENPFPWTAQMDYRVVVSDRFKYIKWLRFDEAELYDLVNDRNELNNLIHQPAYLNVVEQMRREMAELQLEALGL